MQDLRYSLRWVVLSVVFMVLAGADGLVAAVDANATRLPADFLDQLVKAEPVMRLTLPNGRQVVGKIDKIQREAGVVLSIRGILQHPESGDFAFERQPQDKTPGKLSGYLRFARHTTQWSIQADVGTGGFRWAEVPGDHIFRPQAMVMPNATKPTAAMSREDAEAALRKDLKIEQLAPGKLRIGMVQLDQAARTVRFPVTVNMTSGPIEYAVVTTTGKCHEALLATQAAPRDIHLALLLLGAKPANLVESPDKRLQVPATASMQVTAEWETNGPLASHSLASLIAIAAQSPDQLTDRTLPEQPWLYNGSRFNDAGFAASVEGSIISLIGDDLALINGKGNDHKSDDIHVPNAKLLPNNGAPVTLVLTLPRPASPPKPPPATP